MSRGSILRCIAVFAILVVCTASISIEAVDFTDRITADEMSPSDFHRILSEAKGRTAIDRPFRDVLLKSQTRVNTQTNYDVLFYEVDLRVNDTTEMLYGRVKFVARATEPSVSEIQVDFLDNMLIDSIVAPSGPLSCIRDGHVVVVALDGVYNTDEEFEFDFYYKGHPIEWDPVYWGFAFHERELYEELFPVISSLSEPYGARSWWPCKDRMDDKADSMKVALTVDTRFYAASNGSLDSTVLAPGHIKTFYYTMPYPIATYLFMVAISDYYPWYDEWVYNDGQDTMPVVHAIYPEWYNYSLDEYDKTIRALNVLSEAYGCYPWAETKYGHVNFEWPGAMEHQSMSSMWPSYGFGFQERVMVHELSHQWWGDLITCKSWADIWLNEGWASYSEALFYGEVAGWGYYHDYMETMDYSEGSTIYCNDTTDMGTIFKLIVYDKGAWVVHMLRHILGDSAFFNAIDDYFSSPYKYGAATTEEFVEAWETSTGRELSWFFEDWIFGEYRPNYHYTYYCEPNEAGGYRAVLAVDQVQTTEPQVFRMPIDFVFELTSGKTDTMSIWVDGRQNTIVLNFPDSLLEAELDPSDWILKYASDVPWRLHFIVDEELPATTQYLDYEYRLRAYGGTNRFTYTLVDGALPLGLELESQTGMISGAPQESGEFTFTVNVDDNGSNYWDESVFTLSVVPMTLIPGDIDASEEIDIADLVFLIDYYFADGAAPPIMNLADVDGSCELDIGDVVYLVEYMFSDGPAAFMGCVE